MEVKITEELLDKIKAKTMQEEGSLSHIQEVGKPETAEWFILVPLLLFETKLAASRSEANRLVTQGAVSIDGKKIDTIVFPDIVRYGYPIKVGSIIKAGKRKFIKLV